MFALIDTSVWVRAVHQKDASARMHLERAVAAGRAAICPIVLAECLAGRTRTSSAEAIRERLTALPMLACDDRVWEKCYWLVGESRARGQTLSATDGLVAAHALVAGAEVLHDDGDFERIAHWAGLRQTRVRA